MNPIFQWRTIKPTPHNTSQTKIGSVSKVSSVEVVDDYSTNNSEHLYNKEETNYTKGGGKIDENSKQSASHIKLFTKHSSILETKQNILAKISLSPQEDHIRQNNSSIDEKSKSLHHEPYCTLQDIEDDDFILPNSSSSTSSSSTSSRNTRTSSATRQYTTTTTTIDDTEQFNKFHNIKKKEPKYIIQNLTHKIWNDLKCIIFGNNNKILQDGWVGQGFIFNKKIPFGLIQMKGGPCGVLAAIQSILLRNLIFGSEYYANEIKIKNIIDLNNDDIIQQIKLYRISALVSTLTEIIWRCSSSEENKNNSIIYFGGGGSEIRVFNTCQTLHDYIHINIHRFDCISVVYSVVLSRGIQNVQNDMDFPNSTLLGQHGYCTQELINLLIIGMATSNPFDNEFILGEKILKGISSQPDIGFLSLFEHYDSCRVGSFLKNPKYPLWIICSESHFSLLFSNELKILENNENDTFNLYYYDGLAFQEWIIKLTIKNGEKQQQQQQSSSAGVKLNEPKNHHHENDDDDLIPPLEKCIRTKWLNATIDWNETEPIL